MSTPFQTFNPGDIIKDTHVEQFIQPIQNLEEGKAWYAEDSGSANAFELTLSPAPSAYTAGMIVHFKAANNVTGAATLEVNGLGTQSLQKEGSASLVNGDIVAGQIVSAIHDGSKFQLISSPLNPTVTSASPSENVLVYSEVRAEQPSTTITALTLPTFSFDSGKSYLLEVRPSSNTAAAYVQVALDDGSNTYVYPSTSDYLRPRTFYGDTPRYSKLLPTLSGLHNVEVRASRMGSVEVKIYEVYDNLVYSDFAPAETGSTVTSYTLQSFTAQTGHTYRLTMTADSSDANAYLAAACYLTNGVDVVGLPYPDPTSDVAKGPYYNGNLSLSKFLTGLSGTYDVITRRAECGGVNVEIHDIT